MCTLNGFQCDIIESDRVSESTISVSTMVTTCTTNDELSYCRKCGSNEIKISLRCQYGYCEMCFLSLSMHKFKATLGKSKSMKPTDSVLIAHSGKKNSTALLHLIKDSTSNSVTSTKCCRFKCKILHIDDGMVTGNSVEERKRIVKELAEEAEHLGLPIYITSLTTELADVPCKKINSTNESLTEKSLSNEKFMRDLFDAVKTETAKDELLRQLRRKVLVSAARKLNCNKIFVAENSIDLAVKVLADVSTGRGSQVPLNVSVSDTRCSDVTLLRPLRDFTEDDVLGYLICHHVTPVIPLSKSRRTYPNSIKSIAEKFVRQLDSDFHSTVSTIYRTSGKMAERIEEGNEEMLEKMNTKTKVSNNSKRVAQTINEDNSADTCIICELTLLSRDSSQQAELSVIQARQFSEFVSTNIENRNIDANTTREIQKEIHCRCKKNNKCGSEGEDAGGTTSSCCDRFQSSIDPAIIERHLCYGCKLAVSISSDGKPNLLANYLYESIEQKLGMKRLREEIAEYLL